MESFTIELISNATFNCYPKNSLSSFKNFLPKQKHLRGEWRLLFQKYRILYCTKTLLSESLLPKMGENVLRKEERFNRCILNLDCIQVLLI